jgi:dTMP kinase
VLCDRYTGSTLAYQGHGRGLSTALIDTLESIATANLKADLTLWLDMSVDESIRRRGGQPGDRIESEGNEFLARVSWGFAIMADWQDWIRINAAQPVAAVTEACRRAMVRHFEGRA